MTSHKFSIENLLDIENAENKSPSPPILERQDIYPQQTFKPFDRQLFDQWYEENREKIKFNLNNTIADYCAHDVILLASGLVKMREFFLQKTGHDITESVTMPSACMKIFREGLTPDELALTPHMGYEHHGTQSVLGRKFLRWYEKLHKVKVRSAESAEGELKCEQYVIDGFVERPEAEKNLCIEVHGCYWHACALCYPEDDQLLAGGIPAGTIRERNAERMEVLQKHFEVKVYWQHEIEEMLERDDQIIIDEVDGVQEIMSMQSYFDNLPDTGLIDLHDCFFGGRTEALWMKSNVVGKNREAKYKDFKSLYPAMNWHTKYPIGHPILKVFHNKRVNWTEPEHMVDNDGFRLHGIIKCFIVPPRHPLHDLPVLPMRVNNTLLFSNCRACARKSGSGRNPEYNCPHFEEHQRGFSTTMTTIELEMALKAGYKVTNLYRAYHWQNASDWSKSIFRKYLQIFMKIKYEADGWPPSCSEEGISEEEVARRKQKYIEEAKLLYGIILDPENVVRNPGLRYIAKLALNSLWGRFALKNRLSVSVVLDNPFDLAEYLENEKIEISSLEQLNEIHWLLCYKTKNEHIIEHSASNVVLALWTTSAARVHLLKHLYLVLEDRLDTKIIYMDTDSIIYEFNKDLGDPLPTGKHLGELGDEYPDHEIQEVLCSAPKAYAIWMKNKADGKDEYIWRLKGIPLSMDNRELLPYERYRDMIDEFAGDPNSEVSETLEIKNNFRIDKKRCGINTIPMKKIMRPVVRKGVSTKNFRIRPFGYSNPNWCRAHNPYDCECKNNPIMSNNYE